MRICHLAIWLFILVLIVKPRAQAQKASPLQKTWLLIQSRSIKEDTILTNVLSELRFDGERMYVTLLNANKEISQPYSLTGNELQAWFVNYTIESITDSSLKLSIPNNRVMYFLAEGYAPCGDSVIKKIGEFNGHPYYKAESYLQPSIAGEPLFRVIEKAIHFDRQKKKIAVSFSFIVNEKGIVQDAKILRSYSAEVDAIVLEQLQRGSGKWQPPIACGVPVATLLSFTFVYDPVVH